MIVILQIFGILIVPYILRVLSNRLRVEAVLSPVVLCYGLGLLISHDAPDESILTTALNIIMELSIALAIPLMLMSADFRAFLRSGKEVIGSFAIAVAAVFLVCITAGFLFKDQTSDSATIAAMLAGVYTGGTPNMAAVKAAIGANESLFGALNIADLLFSAIYLLFLTSVGPSVFRYLLKQRNELSHQDQASDILENAWLNMSIREKAISLLRPIGLSILSVLFAAGLSFLLFNKLNMSLFIILITVAGILVSLSPLRGRLVGSYEAGDYLLLVFCFCIGLVSNFEDLANASITVISFTAFVITATILLHLLLARLFKMDSEITIITSVACIFGPIFVGQVVSVMKNRSMIVPGMTMGVAGIALGSLLGIFVHGLLQYLLS